MKEYPALERGAFGSRAFGLYKPRKVGVFNRLKYTFIHIRDGKLFRVFRRGLTLQQRKNVLEMYTRPAVPIFLCDNPFSIVHYVHDMDEALGGVPL